MEPLLITAQKRPQRPEEVPISMSVLDRALLEREGVTDFHDAARFVPNASVDAEGPFPNVRIRGFGREDLNKAFEESVGLVVDGIPYGRRQFLQGGLLDVERIEVLRGPQGTLFGRNNTAGLFHVVTRDPTEEVEGFVDGRIGERGERRFESGVGGPVLPGRLTFRVAGLFEDRDGFLRNTTSWTLGDARSKTDELGRRAVRVKLGAPDVLGAALVLGYEHAESSFSGAGSEIRSVPPAFRRFLAQFDPGVDVRAGNSLSSIDLDERSERRSDVVTANVERIVHGWRLALVAGYAALATEDRFDPDHSPAPLFRTDSEDDNRQTTLELRAITPRAPGIVGLERLFGIDLGYGNATLGFFYQRREIDDSKWALGLDPIVLGGALAASAAPADGAVPALPPRSSLPGPASEQSILFFEQDLDVVAGFAQAEWSPRPRWTVIGGLRLEHVEKRAEWDRILSAGEGVIAQAFSIVPFEASRTRDALELSPRASVHYDWTPSVSTYFGWARGHRSGGFNEFALNGNPESLDYGSEDADSWEVGAKGLLLDGRFRFGLALFWMEVDGLQLLTTDPENLDQRVVNAGEARVRGVELDLRWRATDWLSFAGALGLNDSEYLRFRLGNCSTDLQNTDGDDDRRCDQSGLPLVRTPEWTATLSSNVALPLAWLRPAADLPVVRDVDLVGGLVLHYEDTQRLAPEGPDDRLRQGSFFRFDGHAGFVHRPWRLRARLFVRNLGDEDTANRIGPIPVVPAAFWSVPEERRMILGEIRWEF